MSEQKRNLSYSGYSTYHTCPYKYHLHYNEKLRSDTTPSHLVFGSAVDQALNVILNKGTVKEAMSAAQKELARMFTENIDLSEKDYDGDLITEETSVIVFEKLKEAGWEGKNFNVLAQSLFDKKMMGETLSENQQKVLRILVFFSFMEKIMLIVQSFLDYVLPQIEEILTVQKNTKRGILDFEAKIKGMDGVIVFDNKTASKDYEENAVRVSVQLASYQASKGAYVVFNKTVRKNRTKTCSVCGNNGTGKRHKTCDAEVGGVRCNGEWIETISPEIIPQVLIDDIPERNREIVEEAFQATEKLIECGVFPRNLSNCGNQYGRPCEYFNLCWKNDPKGLVKK